MQESLNNFNYQPEKMKNTINVQLFEGDQLVKEVEVENLVTDIVVNTAKAMYATYLGMPHNFSACITTPSIYSISGRIQRLNLWGNTTTFTDNLYPDYNNGAMNLVGYNDSLKQSFVDTIGGVFLPTATTYGNGSVTLNWEWATTQGNGTIKSIGFSNLNEYYSYSTNYDVLYRENVPGLAVRQACIGYKTEGSDKILYMRTYGSTTDNITLINETDYSQVSQLSLNPGTSMQNNSFSYSNSDTVYCDGNFYTVTAVANGSITMKKAPENTQTYGSTFPVSFTNIGSYSQYYINSITCDEQYMYVAFAGYTSSVVYKNLILKIDSATDTVVSTTDISTKVGNVGSGGNWSASYKIIKDMFDASTIWIAKDNGTIYKYDIVSTTLSVRYCSNTSTSAYTDFFYVKDGNAYIRCCNSTNSGIVFASDTTPMGSSLNYYPLALFRVFGVKNDGIMSYAELATPINKTSTQSMRIQYTMQVF